MRESEKGWQNTLQQPLTKGDQTGNQQERGTSHSLAKREGERRSQLVHCNKREKVGHFPRKGTIYSIATVIYSSLKGKPPLPSLSFFHSFIQAEHGQSLGEWCLSCIMQLVYAPIDHHQCSHCQPNSLPSLLSFILHPL